MERAAVCRRGSVAPTANTAMMTASSAPTTMMTQRKSFLSAHARMSVIDWLRIYTKLALSETANEKTQSRHLVRGSQRRARSVIALGRVSDAGHRQVALRRCTHRHYKNRALGDRI